MSGLQGAQVRSIRADGRGRVRTGRCRLLLRHNPARVAGLAQEAKHLAPGDASGAEWQPIARIVHVLDVHVGDAGPVPAQAVHQILPAAHDITRVRVEHQPDIGRGEIDLKGLVSVLREIGYAGPIALELEVTDPEILPRYVAEAHAYMTGLLA
jgi:sugar phosphate isomerase/epimerase